MFRPKGKKMNKMFLIPMGMLISILAANIVSASDVLVWQGQYFTGTTFNTGTYEFNFSVYDAPNGGNICYSNATNLTTGNFGEWITEQIGVSSACNNASKDYYLNINIGGADQTPRRRLNIFNFLRKDVDEATAGDLVLHGVLQGLSPLKLQDEINFIKADGIITSSLYNAPRETPSTLPSIFADSLIHDIIEETNEYGMQECFWDENTETMQMCISGAYLAGRATTVSRSLQVVGNTTNKPINENFTLCEGNKYVDCETDVTGADFLVEDDIESIGSIFSQENITADDTGFFNLLGSLANRTTKLFVQDIDASGNVNASNYTLNGTTIDDWSDVTGSADTDTHVAGDGDYLTNDSTTMYFNETKLNATIDARTTTSDLTNYALKNQSETFAGNITTIQTGFFGWIGSLISRITKLWVVDINATGNIETSQNVSAKYFIGNGSLLTNLPAGELTPVYLGSDLNATSAAYTTIFTIALTPGKMNIVHVYLAQSSSTAGTAIQNRVIVNESGPVGYCNFVTQTGGADAVDTIAVSTNSADTEENKMSLDTGIPFINTVTCTVIADSNQKDLIIQFDSEDANNVTTYAGSYYTYAVN